MRFLYLDWLSLSDPASPMVDTCYLREHFDSRTTAQDIRETLGEFAAKCEGTDPSGQPTLVVSAAVRDAFVADQRRQLSTDPSAAIVGLFLKKHPSRSVGVGLSKSGFVTIAVECEAGNKKHRGLMRDTAECVAALLFRLIGIAATGRAPDRGLELSMSGKVQTFLISPLTIMPVAVEVPASLADAPIGQLAADALAGSQLQRVKVDRQIAGSQGLLQNQNALHALARRFTAMADQSVRQIEVATLPLDGGASTNELAREKATDGYIILKRINRWLWGSTAFLCCMFLALIFLPSIALVRDKLGLGTLNHEAIPWLFTLFFGFALLITYAVMGLERLFDYRPQDERIRSWNPFGPSFWAIVLFGHRLILPALVLLFIWFSVWVFWYGHSPPVPWDLLGRIGIEKFAFATKDAATFVTILQTLTWAFPALAVGLIKFSHDKLTGIVIGTQEDSRYQLYLEKCDPILAAGENYVRQMKIVLGARKAATLPIFDTVRQRVTSTRARLAKLIEEAKTRFNRSAAATVAIVGAIAAIPGLARIEPDPLAPQLAQWFEEGRLAGENVEAAGTRCLAESGDKCSPDQQGSWNIGYSVGTQSRHFREIDNRLKEKLSVTVNLEGYTQEELGKLISESVIKALRHKGESEAGEPLTKGELLVKAITMGIMEAPRQPPPEPSLKVNTKEIAREILEQFKEDSFPVLHALPKPCRPDSRRVASVYFVRTKTTWAQATCVSIKGKTSYRTKAGKVDQKTTNESDACWMNRSPAEEVNYAKAKLSSAIAERLKARPMVKQILVVGYADSTGPVNSNIRVSNERAAEVANYLRNELGNKAKDVSFSAIGRSEASLAGDFRRGDLYQSAASRRVEVRFCYPSPADVNAVLRCAGFCGD